MQLAQTFDGSVGLSDEARPAATSPRTPGGERRRLCVRHWDQKH